MNQIGVKELKEAIVAAVLVGKLAAVLMKDGVQMEDAVALMAKMQDAEFKAKVMAGVEGMDKIPAELKDLQLAEMLEVAQVIPEVIAILKA